MAHSGVARPFSKWTEGLLQPFWVSIPAKGQQADMEQFHSQTAQCKPSVKHSPWISPLKVGVEQCVVLFKEDFYNKHRQGLQLHVAIMKCFKEWIIFS